MTFVLYYLPSGWSLRRRAGLYAPLWGREKGRRKDGPGESTPFTFTEASQDPRPFTGIISFIARGSETETRAQDHNGLRWWSCRARARACRLDAAAASADARADPPGRTRLLGPGPSRNRRRGHNSALRLGSGSGLQVGRVSPPPGPEPPLRAGSWPPPLPGGSSGGPADSAQTEPRREGGRGGAWPDQPPGGSSSARPSLRPAPPPGRGRESGAAAPAEQRSGAAREPGGSARPSPGAG